MKITGAVSTLGTWPTDPHNLKNITFEVVEQEAESELTKLFVECTNERHNPRTT